MLRELFHGLPPPSEQTARAGISASRYLSAMRRMVTLPCLCLATCRARRPQRPIEVESPLLPKITADRFCLTASNYCRQRRRIRLFHKGRVQPSRLRRANFFVAVEKERQLLEIVKPNRLQRAHGIHADQHATLHVAYARTEQFVAFAAQGALRASWGPPKRLYSETVSLKRPALTCRS